MGAWEDVDKFRELQLDLWFANDIRLMRHGWFLLETNDGTWAARRIREGDEPGEPREGAPEASHHDFEVLLAIVKARGGGGVVNV